MVQPAPSAQGTPALHLATTLGVLCIAVLGMSCSEDPIQPVPSPEPTNDTPSNTIARFTWMYQQKRADAFEKLLTGDFTFEFSNAADPNLVQKYSTGWFKEDEKISAENLFRGGVNQDGVFQPAALQIAVTFGSTAPTGDNGSGRNPEVYKVLYTTVDVSIEVPGDLTYVVGQGTPQFHRFFLVRGDYADSLDADQPADSLHWYIWNWRDESPPLKAEEPLSNQSATWGLVKAVYR